MKVCIDDRPLIWKIRISGMG